MENYREEKQLSTYSSGWNPGPYWGPRWYGYRGAWGGYGGGYTSTTTSTIWIGTISLDFFDAGNKTLVWRGQATKTVEVKAKPDKQKKNIAKAAQKLLHNYPPKKEKWEMLLNRNEPEAAHPIFAADSEEELK